MKKLNLLFIGIAICSIALAQNEKVNGDEMASRENYSGAAVMYRMCMEQDVECRLKLVRLLYEAKIEPQTPDELYRLTTPLANKRNAEAQFYMGEIYSKGIGVRQNVREAKKWYQQSASQGYSLAKVKSNELTATSDRAAASRNEPSGASGKTNTSRMEKSGAQTNAKHKGRYNSASIGIGFPGMQYSDFGYTSIWPAFSLIYERSLPLPLFNEKGSLGAGIQLGYSYAKGYGDTLFENESKDFVAGIRVTLYYSLLEKFDGYAGVMGGYNRFSRTSSNWYNSDYTTSMEPGGEATFNIFVGARYSLTDYLSLFIEGGYGFTYVNGGLSIRF